MTTRGNSNNISTAEFNTMIATQNNKKTRTGVSVSFVKDLSRGTSGSKPDYNSKLNQQTNDLWDSLKRY